MRKKKLILGLLVLGLGLGIACQAASFLARGSSRTPALQPSRLAASSPTPLQLATPVAAQPAAGICAEFPAELVTVTIYPDIPDPRCTQIRPEQRLRVVNARQEAVEISLAGLAAHLEPGTAHEYTQPFGSLLAPGVHRLDVSPCCAAELWLRLPQQETPAAPENPAEDQPQGDLPPGAIQPPYLDDRSSPQALILSLYNAIDRREYARAYDYWETSAPKPDYAQFRQGYTNTARVDVTTGPVGSDAGAGQTYYSLPVYLLASLSDGATRAYAGCYILHMSIPAIQGTPPFRPLQISNAEVRSVVGDTKPDELLAHACDRLAPGVHLLAPGPEFPEDEIGPDRYLDDRSKPLAVLRSLFNAINRREYLRAYTYWDYAAEAEAFNRFAAGYANTRSVALMAGSPLSAKSSGALSYQVPVTLIAQTIDGATQTYVGCYTLRQLDPELQDAPPFQPLHIVSAEVQQVFNDANTLPLMAGACPGF